MRALLLALAVLLAGCTNPLGSDESNPADGQTAPGTAPARLQDEGALIRTVGVTATVGNFDTDPAKEVAICYFGKDNEGAKHPFKGAIRYTLSWKTRQYGSKWQQIDTWVIQASPEQFTSQECSQGSFRELLQPPSRYDENRSDMIWKIWVNARFTATGEEYAAEQTW